MKLRMKPRLEECQFVYEVRKRDAATAVTFSVKNSYRRDEFQAEDIPVDELVEEKIISLSSAEAYERLKPALDTDSPLLIRYWQRLAQILRK